MALLEIKKQRFDADGKRAEGDNGDSYLSKLVKLIPAEVMALYTSGLAQIPALLPPNQMLVPALWLVVCFIIVIVVRILATKNPNTSPDWKIVTLSAIAFLIWSYSGGGPWETYGLYLPYLGSLAVMFWTFFAPYIYQEQ